MHPLLHLYARQLSWSSFPVRTRLHLRACTPSSPAQPVLALGLQQQKGTGQHLQPPPVPGSSSLLLTVTHPPARFHPVQLYNEEILDLFDSARDPDARHRKSNIKIHEDASGSIYTTGVTSRLISSQDEVGSAPGGAAEEGSQPGMLYVGSKARRDGAEQPQGGAGGGRGCRGVLS